jgi:integrase
MAGISPDASVSSVSHRFRAFCRTGGVEGPRFRDLRHAVTSRLLELGLTPMEVAAFTGHNTLEMRKRYAHPSAEAVARKLD